MKKEIKVVDYATDTALDPGVRLTLVRYQWMIHDYGMLNPLVHVPEVQSALRYAASELRSALQ